MIEDDNELINFPFHTVNVTAAVDLGMVLTFMVWASY